MSKGSFYAVSVILFTLCSNLIMSQTNIPQPQTTVNSGDRVRIKVTGMQDLVGKFGRSTGDSVVVQLGKSYNNIMMVVPKDQIVKIEVSQKPRFTPGQKILIGTLIGAAAGALFGLVVPESPTFDDGGFYYWTRGGTVMLWSAIGAGSGLIVGIGVAAASPERWTPASIAGNKMDQNNYITGISLGWRIRF